MIQFYGNLRSVISWYRKYGMKIQLALKGVGCQSTRGILSTVMGFVQVIRKNIFKSFRDGQVMLGPTDSQQFPLKQGLNAGHGLL